MRRQVACGDQCGRDSRTRLTRITLSRDDCRDVLGEVAGLGLRSRAVYDTLHASCARKEQVDQTLDAVRHAPHEKWFRTERTTIFPQLVIARRFPDRGGGFEGRAQQRRVAGRVQEDAGT